MISKSFANSVNAAIFGGAPLEIDTWYFGLTTQDIIDGVIPDGSELKTNGYARYPLPNNSSSFNTPAYSSTTPISSVTNAKNIVYKIFSSPEILVTNWFMSKEQTGNTVEIWGKFKTPISLNTGTKVTIPAGNLILTINNG